MFLVFFLFWLILNGRVTVEIVIFGLVISAAVYVFCCKFLEYSPKKDLAYVRKLPLLVTYLYTLVKEIVKANMVMASYIFHPDVLAEPALVYFHTDLKSRTAQVLLANAITLTPGTITVKLQDGDYCVHCYDKSMGEGIEESVFVQILRRLEE